METYTPEDMGDSSRDQSQTLVAFDGRKNTLGSSSAEYAVMTLEEF